MAGRYEQYGSADEWSQRQITYYRARAAEFDNSYADRMHMSRLVNALDGLPISGDVLELACGTGQWTRLISSRARSLTALDAAPDMLSVTRERMRGSTTRFVEANIFDWEPDRQYDTVFFAFWLSHVPPAEVEGFWALLRWALAPGGCAVFLDDSPAKAEIEDPVPGAPVPAVHRVLSDGSRHLAVKVLRDPAGVTSQLDRLGWESHVETVDAFHLSGVAHPREEA